MKARATLRSIQLLYYKTLQLKLGIFGPFSNTRFEEQEKMDIGPNTFRALCVKILLLFANKKFIAKMLIAPTGGMNSECSLIV